MNDYKPQIAYWGKFGTICCTLCIIFSLIGFRWQSLYSIGTVISILSFLGAVFALISKLGWEQLRELEKTQGGEK